MDSVFSMESYTTSVSILDDDLPSKIGIKPGISNKQNDRGHSEKSFYGLSNQPIRFKKALLEKKLWRAEILLFSVVLLCHPQARQFLSFGLQIFLSYQMNSTS